MYIAMFRGFVPVKLPLYTTTTIIINMEEIGNTKREIIERLLAKGQTVSEIRETTGFSQSWIKDTRTKMERLESIQRIQMGRHKNDV